jgi:hypothetical protein
LKRLNVQIRKEQLLVLWAAGVRLIRVGVLLTIFTYMI